MKHRRTPQISKRFTAVQRVLSLAGLGGARRLAQHERGDGGDPGLIPQQLEVMATARRKLWYLQCTKHLTLTLN